MNSKKQARRDRAKARFNIMPLTAWISARSQKHDAVELSDANYAGYVARKQEERIALGL